MSDTKRSHYEPSENEPSGDEQPTKRRVLIPIRRGKRHPLARTEITYVETDADTAGQWDESQWHSRPPGV